MLNILEFNSAFKLGMVTLEGAGDASHFITLVFAVPQGDSTIKYYVMDVMPFGYGPAIAVQDWTLNPVMNFFRQEAIKTGVLLMTMLQIYGWNISWPKCQLIPVQVLLYQGLLVDLVAMKYRALVEKVEYACRHVNRRVDPELSVRSHSTGHGLSGNIG